jgi:hypothetical protein
MLRRLTGWAGVLSAVLMLSGVAPAASEELYDAYGRRIPDSQVYPGPQPYYQQQPQPYYQPQQQYYPQPRQSRYQQGNICATPYGVCDLVGPTFVGKGCRCSLPGVGRVSGAAAVQ